jgi:hypothetical protein
MADFKAQAFQRLIVEVGETANELAVLGVDVPVVARHARDWSATLERLQVLSVHDVSAGHLNLAGFADNVAVVRRTARHDIPRALQLSDVILVALGELPGDPTTPERGSIEWLPGEPMIEERSFNILDGDPTTGERPPEKCP